MLRLFTAVTVMVFAFFCFKTVYALIYRVMRCRLKEDELVCCAVTFVVFGTGFYNVTGQFVYTAAAAGLIVFFVRLTKSPAAVVAALIIAVPPSVAALSPDYLTACVALSTAALLFAGAGRVAPSVISAALTAAYEYFTGGFDCAVALIFFRAMILFCT